MPVEGTIIERLASIIAIPLVVRGGSVIKIVAEYVTTAMVEKIVLEKNFVMDTDCMRLLCM